MAKKKKPKTRPCVFCKNFTNYGVSGLQECAVYMDSIKNVADRCIEDKSYDPFNRDAPNNGVRKNPNKHGYLEGRKRKVRNS